LCVDLEQGIHVGKRMIRDLEGGNTETLFMNKEDTSKAPASASLGKEEEKECGFHGCEGFCRWICDAPSTKEGISSTRMKIPLRLAHAMPCGASEDKT
jgi:hypothetical protein